jgi:hypothetical protein
MTHATSLRRADFRVTQSRLEPLGGVPVSRQRERRSLHASGQAGSNAAERRLHFDLRPAARELVALLQRDYAGRIVIIAGIHPQARMARTSAVSHQRVYTDSWIRQTGMETPKNRTLVRAMLAHSMSSR